MYASAGEKRFICTFYSFRFITDLLELLKFEGFEENDAEETNNKKKHSVALDGTFSPFSLTANPIDENKINNKFLER